MPEPDDERERRIRQEADWGHYTMPRDVRWILEKLDRAERPSPTEGKS